jgi:hypothetical protein
MGKVSSGPPKQEAYQRINDISRLKSLQEINLFKKSITSSKKSLPEELQNASMIKFGSYIVLNVFDVSNQSTSFRKISTLNTLSEKVRAVDIDFNEYDNNNIFRVIPKSSYSS